MNNFRSLTLEIDSVKEIGDLGGIEEGALQALPWKRLIPSGCTGKLGGTVEEITDALIG